MPRRQFARKSQHVRKHPPEGNRRRDEAAEAVRPRAREVQDSQEDMLISYVGETCQI